MLNDLGINQLDLLARDRPRIPNVHHNPNNTVQEFQMCITILTMLGLGLTPPPAMSI
jgi:hypothetical protein